MGETGPLSPGWVSTGPVQAPLAGVTQGADRADTRGAGCMGAVCIRAVSMGEGAMGADSLGAVCMGEVSMGEGCRVRAGQ